MLAAAAACLLLVTPFSDTLAIHTYVRDLKGQAVPVQSVPIEAKQIGLTFDVGLPGDRIGDLLPLLQEAKVRATFFLSGEWVEKNPKTALAIVKAGHEAGRTLYLYRPPNERSETDLRAELAQTDHAFAAAGLPENRLFRIPYGESDGRLSKLVRERGDRLIGFSINADGQGLPRVLDQLEEALHPGTLLRLRADRATVEQLPALLQRIRDKGYRLSTVTALSEEVKR